MFDLGDKELEKQVDNCIAAFNEFGIDAIRICRLVENGGKYCIDCIKDGSCEVCKRYFKKRSEKNDRK